MISEVRSFANAGQYQRAIAAGELLERYPLGEVGVVLSEILCDVDWKSGKPKDALERAVKTAALFPKAPAPESAPPWLRTGFIVQAAR